MIIHLYTLFLFLIKLILVFVYLISQLDFNFLNSVELSLHLNFNLIGLFIKYLNEANQSRA